MRTAWITDRTAREVVAVASDEYVYAAQEEERVMDEREEVDRLMAEVDRELAEVEEMAEWRARRRFNDTARIHRARRRAEREHLALLEQQQLIAGMPGQGKSSVAVLRALAGRHVADGEVAA